MSAFIIRLPPRRVFSEYNVLQCLRPPSDEIFKLPYWCISDTCIYIYIYIYIYIHIHTLYMSRPVYDYLLK